MRFVFFNDFGCDLVGFGLSLLFDSDGFFFCQLLFGNRRFFDSIFLLVDLLRCDFLFACLLDRLGGEFFFEALLFALIFDVGRDGFAYGFVLILRCGIVFYGNFFNGFFVNDGLRGRSFV